MKVWKSIFLTVIFVFLVEGADLMLLLPELFIDIIPYSVWSLSIISLFADIIILICIYIFLSKKGNLQSSNKNNEVSLTLCALAAITGIFFVFLQPIFHSLILGEAFTKYFGGGIEFWLLPKLIGSILIVPITEELFFRSFLMKKLGERYNEKNGIFISSLLFALAHLPNPEQVIIAFGGGLIASYFYLKRDSIIPAIIFHIAWNFTAKVLFCLL